jgi:hypothetical protein
MRWAGHVERVEYRRGTYRILVGRPERMGIYIYIFSLSLSGSAAQRGYGLLVLEIS